MAVTRALQQQLKVTYLKDYKTSGTVPQTLTAGAGSNTRTLNTQEGDTSFATLTNGTTGTGGTANQFIVQPGTYIIEANSGVLRANDNCLQLFNVTDSAIIIDHQMNQWSDAVDADGSTIAVLHGVFTLTSTKTLSLRHRVSTTQAGGTSATFGSTEMYTVVKLTKIT